MSQLFAFAAPILPGKFAQWEKFLSKIQNEYSEQFKESRRKYGIRERSFIQRLPNHETVVVTLEGENPLEAFAKIANENSEFTNWFIEQVKEVHGFDMRDPSQAPPIELIVDTQK